LETRSAHNVIQEADRCVRTLGARACPDHDREPGRGH
jgi:hypothetical protein